MQGFNVAEVIPYRNFREMTRIVKQEIRNGRYVEIWDGCIYSAEKWGEL